ncbi:MAG: DinB family protein, partial [Sphingomonas sp.]
MGQAAASRSPNPGELAGEGLHRRYREVRALSEYLVTPLSEADATLQSMADASPAKWHLAHTTWFFETFLVVPQVPDYARFGERWP